MSILDKTYHDTSRLSDGEVRIWCDEDQHQRFEYFTDFNEWLDGGDGYDVRVEHGIEGLSQPSKAFYAGDPEAYNQVFKVFRQEQRERILSEVHIKDQFGDEHWYEKNDSRFEQLMKCLVGQSIVPFVGAGLSVDGGFPAWSAHLRQQGKTSGIDPERIEELLDNGRYEEVIEEIEKKGYRDAFIQEIKDVYSKTGDLTDTILRLSELFNDTILTTNYDQLVENAFKTGVSDTVETLVPSSILADPDPKKTTIIKLHGDIENPAHCILGKNQYDEAYGNPDLNLKKPIPKLLSYHYRTSNLLFLGCSLNQDRTMQVFKAIKEEMGDIDRPSHFCLEAMPEDEAELVERNKYLLDFGIIPIWFPKGQYDYIEQILRLAKNELRYRGYELGQKQQYVELAGGEVEDGTNVNQENTKPLEEAKKGKNKVWKILATITTAVVAIIAVLAGVAEISGYSLRDYFGGNSIDSFSLTVLVHGKEGKDDILLKNQGKVVLDIGGDRKEEAINMQGEATFKELPGGFIDKKALISIDHPEPYFPIKRNEEYLLEENKAIYLAIELKDIDKIQGRIIDETTQKPLDSVRVSVKNVATYSDEFGWYELGIPEEIQGKFIRANFFKEGYKMQNLDSIAPYTKQEIDISLQKD